MPSCGSSSRRRLAGPPAPGHRVDRQVAAGQVLLDPVAELDPVGPPEVGVLVVGPERRDLERLAVLAEPRPSRTGSRRRRPGNSSTIRSGRASVARSQSATVAAEHPVAERATDHVRGVASGLEDRDDVEDLGRQRADRCRARTVVVRQFRPRNR